ncbi:MAG: gliding motility-associated C-terminal domain-containing protein [Bacteroidota bacterium]|nr:gliding motility-associated C-terminal domain-containing protein [Bacteroidota bacterium]
MKKFCLIIFFIYFFVHAFATHNRAGEITYRCLHDRVYQITIITYTFTESPADRPTLDIFFGDEDSTGAVATTINRVNGPNGDGEIISGTKIKKNIYIANHTYNTNGEFLIRFEDPNRNAGVINIPNSVAVPFYVETKLIINPFLGSDNSPVLLNPPIDNACTHQIFVHNPGAYDPDGDSLTYDLIKCKGADGTDIPGYTYPSANKSFKIDHNTGTLIWDSPEMQGEYNVAILISEYRYGFLIGSIIRDMQITVADCNNHPPVIIAINDTCIEAGTYFNRKVKAYDTDHNFVTLTCSGEVIQSKNANFTATSGRDTVISNLTWQTLCKDVRKQPYFFYFKAVDDGKPNLIDFKSLSITVVCPSVKNLNSLPLGNSMHLNWNRSVCSGGRGYKIYRRTDSYDFKHGYCETGVPDYTGFSLIGSVNDLNDTTFVDNNNGDGLIHGVTYCYLVIVYYADGSESYASNETCNSLIKDVPVITNISIKSTDEKNGSVIVSWTKPQQIDTIKFPSPYKYLIYRSADVDGFKSYTLVDSLKHISDTTFTNNNLDTRNHSYKFRIDFYCTSNSVPLFIGSTYKASSVYLNISPTDHVLILKWSATVPWTNKKYVIFKKNEQGLFDSLTTTINTSYTDSNLINKKEYCYYIKTIGEYSDNTIFHPLINFSQIACEEPIDNIPPCPPELKVKVDCNVPENDLYWTNIDNKCSKDIASYKVYYKNFKDGDFQRIATVLTRSDTQYVHSENKTIAGCYAIMAIDSANNESRLSNIICIDIDSCKKWDYNLPNVFTPNNDGINDYFRPFPYSYVDKINIKIFNRWGTLVFQSDNPEINWDGKDQFTKRELSDGVYFYICDIYELRLSGVQSRTIKGFFHIIKESNSHNINN